MHHAPEDTNVVSAKTERRAKESQGNRIGESSAATEARRPRFRETEEFHNGLPNLREPGPVHCGQIRVCDLWQLPSNSELQARPPSITIVWVRIGWNERIFQHRNLDRLQRNPSPLNPSRGIRPPIGHWWKLFLSRIPIPPSGNNLNRAACI